MKLMSLTYFLYIREEIEDVEEHAFRCTDRRLIGLEAEGTRVKRQRSVGASNSLLFSAYTLPLRGRQKHAVLGMLWHKEEWEWQAYIACAFCIISS